MTSPLGDTKLSLDWKMDLVLIKMQIQFHSDADANDAHLWPGNVKLSTEQRIYYTN